MRKLLSYAETVMWWGLLAVGAFIALGLLGLVIETVFGLGGGGDAYNCTRYTC